MKSLSADCNRSVADGDVVSAEGGDGCRRLGCCAGGRLVLVDGECTSAVSPLVDDLDYCIWSDIERSIICDAGSARSRHNDRYGSLVRLGNRPNGSTGNLYIPTVCPDGTLGADFSTGNDGLFDVDDNMIEGQDQSELNYMNATIKVTIRAASIQSSDGQGGKVPGETVTTELKALLDSATYPDIIA